MRRNALIALGVLGAVVTTSRSARASGKDGGGPHADLLLGEALERYADEPASLDLDACAELPIVEVGNERSHFAAHARRLSKRLTATGAYGHDELVAMKLILLDYEQQAAVAEDAALPGLYAELVAELTALPRADGVGAPTP